MIVRAPQSLNGPLRRVCRMAFRYFSDVPVARHSLAGGIRGDALVGLGPILILKLPLTRFSGFLPCSSHVFQVFLGGALKGMAKGYNVCPLVTHQLAPKTQDLGLRKHQLPYIDEP